MRISEKDIRFVPNSLLDTIGRVFEYENKIYRGIYSENIDYLNAILNCGLITELVNKKLFPNTVTTELESDTFPLILEHEKLFLSKPYEWTFDMLRDAAITTVEVNKIALKYGYQIKDGHSYNILFKDNKAYFIDLGSFIPKKGVDFYPSTEFLGFFCLPLALMAKNKHYIAHKLQLDYHFPNSRILIDKIPSELIKIYSIYQVLRVQLFGFTFDFPQNKYLFLPSKLIAKIFRKLNLNRITARFLLSDNVEFLLNKLNYRNKTLWSQYQDKYFNSDAIQTTERFDTILEYINNLKNIDSVLDVAANRGLVPVLLNRNLGFKKIIHLDYDVNACNAAYLYYKANNLPIDIICTSFFELALNNMLRERLRSDLVLGLAISHHLLLSQFLSISTIFSVFSDLSNKYVVIEFMPLGLWNGETAPPLPEWYNLDWFRINFLKYFDIIVERKIELNRIVFIGAKKNEL